MGAILLIVHGMMLLAILLVVVVWSIRMNRLLKELKDWSIKKDDKATEEKL